MRCALAHNQLYISVKTPRIMQQTPDENKKCLITTRILIVVTYPSSHLAPQWPPIVGRASGFDTWSVYVSGGVYVVVGVPLYVYVGRFIGYYVSLCKQIVHLIRNKVKTQYLIRNKTITQNLISLFLVNLNCVLDNSAIRLCFS